MTKSQRRQLMRQIKWAVEELEKDSEKRFLASIKKGEGACWEQLSRIRAILGKLSYKVYELAQAEDELYGPDKKVDL